MVIDNLDELIQMEMLNLTKEDLIFENPFEKMKREDLDDFHVYVLKLMRKPEHFYFTCKYLFNIKLMPFQCVILHELWHRPFPMLIGSRGLGKCVDTNTYVVTNKGFSRFTDLVGDIKDEMVPRYETDLKLLSESGYNQVEYSWNNGLSKTKKITTRHGFQINCTYNHPLRVVRDGENRWVDADNIRVGDYVPIDRTPNWFPETNDLDEDWAYLFGLLVGDGGYSSEGHIGFTTADESLAQDISRISNSIWGKPFNKITAKYQYQLSGKYIRKSLFDRFGFVGERSGEKDFPKSVLSASKKSVAAFVRGLMDTDGTAGRQCLSVEYASKSKKLVETLQFVLLRFGIVSSIKVKRNKKYDRDYYYLYIFSKNAELFAKEIGFGLKRKQDILLSHLSKESNPNTDVIPRGLILDDLLGLSEEWRSVRPVEGRGYLRDRQLLTPSRLKNYSISYATLKNILEITEPVSWCAEWQRLKNVLNQNYFYDEIKKIEDDEAVTYDVHMVSDDDRSFVSNGFISHNSFILGLYAVLRAVFIQGRKVVITGSGFRQAKTVFAYSENVWNNAPILRNMMAENPNSGPSHGADRWVLRLGDSTVSALPMGDGSKIRGERAHDIIGDEFASISREIFETVIRGFGVVSLSPVEQVENEARKRVLRNRGKWSDELDESERTSRLGNQTIISGTAYYQFNHFCDYWKLYKGIIESKGDKKKLHEVFASVGKDVDPNLDWRDYSIVRMPVELLPDGYMDAKQVAASKAQLHSGIYMNEFGAVFSSDSNGFFRRSLVESCVTNNPVIVNGEPVRFHAVVKGNPNGRYVYGIDPASEHDRFSIVILEVFPDHRRFVFCWTTTRQEHQARIKSGMVVEKDFYGFCARKIRELMRFFPCEHIALDSQGGGIAVREALHDPDKFDEKELPIWEINTTHPLSDGKERTTDDFAGLHILEMVNFAKAEWTAEANHGMRKDLEDKVLLFPAYDSAILAVAMEDDHSKGRLFDTLEDSTYEIEQCKEELATIIHSQTPGTNRDKWDTPEVKLPGSKKGRLRKDRYSALLMANAAARKLSRQPEQPEMLPYGGFVGRIKLETDKQPAYYGPEWFTKTKSVDLSGYGMATKGGGVTNGVRGRIRE